MQRASEGLSKILENLVNVHQIKTKNECIAFSKRSQYQK